MNDQKSPVAEEVQQFERADQFIHRTRYRPLLNIAPEELGQIIGKYTLPPDEASYIHCGLNGCDQRHRHGFLLNNAAGDETNCGQDCGEREFGVKFKEVEAIFEKRLDEQARQRALNSLLLERTALANEAERLLPLTMKMAAEMQRFLKDFQSKTAFWGQVLAVARLGGEIRGAADETSRGGAGRSAVALVTIGRLEGSAILISSNVNRHHRAILHRIKPWLRDELGAPGIEALDQKKLEKLLADAASIRRDLADGEKFCKDGETFLEPTNLLQLELIRTRLMPRHGDSNALKRSIKRWGEHGPAPGIQE